MIGSLKSRYRTACVSVHMCLSTKKRLTRGRRSIVAGAAERRGGRTGDLTEYSDDLIVQHACLIAVLALSGKSESARR